MIELFGEMPHDLLHFGKNSNRWFTAEGFYFIPVLIPIIEFAKLIASL